jgi:GTP-dependent phosphoenolpyruvate carboxykinase
VDEATHIDLDDWKVELESIGTFFETLGPTLPKLLELHREIALERVRIMRDRRASAGAR